METPDEQTPNTNLIEEIDPLDEGAEQIRQLVISGELFKDKFSASWLGLDEPEYMLDAETGLNYILVKEFRLIGFNPEHKNHAYISPVLLLLTPENRKIYGKYWRDKYKNRFGKLFKDSELSSLKILSLDLLFDNLISYDETYAKMILFLIDDLETKYRVYSLKYLFLKVLMIEHCLRQNPFNWEVEGQKERFSKAVRYLKFGIQYRMNQYIDSSCKQKEQILSGVSFDDFPIFDFTSEQKESYLKKREEIKSSNEQESVNSQIRLKNDKGNKTNLHRVIIALYKLGFFTDPNGGKVSLIQVEKAFTQMLVKPSSQLNLEKI